MQPSRQVKWIELPGADPWMRKYVVKYKQPHCRWSLILGVYRHNMYLLRHPIPRTHIHRDPWPFSSHWNFEEQVPSWARSSLFFIILPCSGGNSKRGNRAQTRSPAFGTLSRFSKQAIEGNWFAWRENYLVFVFAQDKRGWCWGSAAITQSFIEQQRLDAPSAYRL